jgi:hypothetical protein
MQDDNTILSVKSELQALLSIPEFWKSNTVNEFPQWNKYFNKAHKEGRREWFGCQCFPIWNGGNVEYLGDVVIGIYNNTDEILSFEHIENVFPYSSDNEQVLDTFLLWPKEIHVPFGGRCFIPLDNLTWTRTILRCPNELAYTGNVFVIYGQFDTEHRKKFFTEPYIMLPRQNQNMGHNYTICFDKGHCLKVEKINYKGRKNTKKVNYDVLCSEGILLEDVVLCPDFHLEDTSRRFNTTRQTRKKEQVSIYKKELLEETCHPRRYLQWCIDYEEQEELNIH